MKRNKKRIKTVPPVTDSPKATVKGISVSDAIREKRRTVYIAFVLTIITAVVYSGVFKNDFINSMITFMSLQTPTYSKDCRGKASCGLSQRFMAAIGTPSHG